MGLSCIRFEEGEINARLRHSQLKCLRDQDNKLAWPLASRERQNRTALTRLPTPAPLDE